MKAVIVILILVCYANLTWGQVESDSIEQYTELNDDRSLPLDLTPFGHRKLNLNRCSANELLELGYLTSEEVNTIIGYRDSLGPFIDVLELQQCDISLSHMRKLKDDCVVYGTLQPVRKKRSKHLFYLTTSSRLEKSKAYLGDSSIYVGSPWQIGWRYCGQLNPNIQIGFNAEKDAGERWLAERTVGFLHGFVSIKKVGRIDQVIAGNYLINLGQGLCFGSGFGTGKSSQVLNIRNTAALARPNTSMNESIGLRGAVVRLNNGLTFFMGSQLLDVSITDSVVTSIRTSGLHRTASELEGKNVLKEHVYGMIYQRQIKTIHLGYHVNHTRFSFPINTKHIQQRFQTNAGFYYNFEALGGQWFGETSVQFSGEAATLNGVHFSPDRSLQIALLYRRYSARYFSRHSRAFSTSSTLTNEQGFYIGLIYSPTSRWRISFYVDESKKVNHLSETQFVPQLDYLLEVHHEKNKSLTWYARLRYRSTYAQHTTDESLPDHIRQNRLNYRFQADWKMSDQLHMRSRMEMMQTGKLQYGFVAYQDIRFSARNARWKLTGRLAFTAIDHFDNRIYTYEHNLPLTYSIPAYQHSGLRHYVIISIPIHHRIRFSMRFAQDLRTDDQGFGSGIDEVSGNRRSTISAQLRYKL
jgi:hypothetical protein